MHTHTHTPVQVLADQQELISIGSMRTQEVARKKCQGRWMIGTDGEGESQGNLSCQRDLVMMMINNTVQTSLVTLNN